MIRSAVLLSALLFGACHANPHQTYQPLQPQAQERQGFGVNAGFQLGGNGPNALQNNNMLMTVIIGLGVISFLQIVTNVVSPFLGKKKDTAAAAAATGSTATNSTTPTTTAAPATAASARSLSDMVDLAEHVLKAIEAIGEDMKHE